MGIPDFQEDLHYTYGDYLKWPENERWEIIEGRPYDMTPAPSVRHQQVLLPLILQFGQFFRGKPCRVFPSPTDVLLSDRNESDEQVDVVVQPDLLVICDLSKIKEKNVRGGPDLVIEILSESTAKRDMDEKLILYEKHGVRCYLIADPWGNTMTVRYLEPDGKYGRPEFFAAGDQLPIRIFDGLTLDLALVFAQ